MHPGLSCHIVSRNMMPQLRKAMAMAVALGVVFPTVQAQSQSTMAKPSIVYILVDDVGWADFSYNHEDENILPGNSDKGPAPFKTPFIDELSAKGLRFAAHYVQPMCTPTRARC
jgi:hypothetical protein